MPKLISWKPLNRVESQLLGPQNVPIRRNLPKIPVTPGSARQPLAGCLGKKAMITANSARFLDAGTDFRLPATLGGLFWLASREGGSYWRFDPNVAQSHGDC